MDVRRFSLFLALACFHCLTPAHANGLWPGQPAPHGWVQFPNGAWGGVTGSNTGGVEVSWYDGTRTRTSTYDRNHFRNPANANYSPPANTNGAPSGLSASRFQQWAGWAGLVASRVAVPLAILYPEQLSDGTGNSADFQECSAISGCSGGWAFLNIPCAASWNSTDVLIDRRLYPGRQTSGSYCPMEQYPDASPLQQYVTFRGQANWPTLAEALGVVIPDPLTPEQVEQLEEEAGPLTYPPGAPQPFHSPGYIAPDIWEPIPFPQEMPQPLPAEVMNPNGYPSEGEGVRTAPVEFPQVTPWPDPAVSPGEWPGDHPNPGTAPDPYTAPSTNPGTNPGANPGTTAVNVTVNFPEEMDVRVQNWPETTDAMIPEPPGGDFGPFPYMELDLGDWEWSPGFLPDSCPPSLVFSALGQTFEISMDNACLVAGWLSYLVIAIATLSAVRVAFGGV